MARVDRSSFAHFVSGKSLTSSNKTLLIHSIAEILIPYSVLCPGVLGIGTAETPKRLRISLANTAPWLIR